MADRTRSVMIRFTDDEYARLGKAWEKAQGGTATWNRMPFAAWLRRTVLNLFPAQPSPAPTPKGPAKVRRIK